MFLNKITQETLAEKLFEILKVSALKVFKSFERSKNNLYFIFCLLSLNFLYINTFLALGLLFEHLESFESLDLKSLKFNLNIKRFEIFQTQTTKLFFLKATLIFMHNIILKYSDNIST